MRESIKKKAETVRKICELIRNSNLVMVSDIEGVKGSQLQSIREKLKGKANLTVVKKRILERALKEISKEKKGIEKLIERLGNVNCLITSQMDPFMLSKIIEDSKIFVSPKVGYVAEDDIVIPAGLTSLMPGPVMTDFNALGVKIKIVSGRINVLQDTVVVKKGEKVSMTAASLLTKLGIKPVKVGPKILVAYENGKIYLGEELYVNEKEYIEKIINAHKQAINLAFNACIFVKEVVEMLLSKAKRDAENLMYNCAIVSKDSIGNLMVIAKAQMFTLAHELVKIDENALSQELKEIIFEETFKGG